MDIGIILGLAFLFFYILVREYSILTSLPTKYFDEQMHKVFRKLDNNRTEIEKIKMDINYCSNCIYYKQYIESIKKGE